MKKTLLAVLLIVLGAAAASAVEAGLTAGWMTHSQDSGFHYGFSASTGLLIPMVKLEAEWYLKAKSEHVADSRDNGLTIGVKLRPQWGKIAPYGVIGLGWEFRKLGFDFDEYKPVSFFGGGVHFYLSQMISLRGDIRFMSFSSENRVKFSAGLFFHL